jgi:hypothetical protein
MCKVEEKALSDPETNPSSESTSGDDEGIDSIDFSPFARDPVVDSDDELSGSALDDSKSGGDGISGHSTATCESDDDRGMIGKDGATLVCMSRIFFIIMLFACSFILSGYIFATMREEENANFEDQVRETRKVVSSIH